MHQQSWADLWHLFLTLLAGEPIHIQLTIWLSIAFVAVMALAGIVDSFFPRRAASRHSARMLLHAPMPELGAAHPQESFQANMPADDVLALDMSDSVTEDSSVNSYSARRSAPQPLRVLKPQKP